VVSTYKALDSIFSTTERKKKKKKSGVGSAEGKFNYVKVLKTA
jgi:hypothetical protein